MNHNYRGTLTGWHVAADGGVALREDEPLFAHGKSWHTMVRGIVAPEKWLMYRYIGNAVKKERKRRRLITEPYTILVLGCGKGSMIVDLKKKFGRDVDVVGLDDTRLQLDLAKRHIQAYGIWPHVRLYDGHHIPYDTRSFDAVCSFGGNPAPRYMRLWFREIRQVLKPGGVCALYLPTAYGKHAFVERWLDRRGVRMQGDTHALSKQEYRELLQRFPASTTRILSVRLCRFFLYPERYVPIASQKQSLGLFRGIHRVLCKIKQRLPPWMDVMFGCYSYLETIVLGRYVDTTAIVVLAKKERTGFLQHT